MFRDNMYRSGSAGPAFVFLILFSFLVCMSLGKIWIIEVLLLCLVGFASGARRFLTLLSSPALPLGSEGSLPCAADFLCR